MKTVRWQVKSRRFNKTLFRKQFIFSQKLWYDHEFISLVKDQWSMVKLSTKQLSYGLKSKCRKAVTILSCVVQRNKVDKVPINLIFVKV